jgi:sporulation protein YlmC with PRC-barrel domain
MRASELLASQVRDEAGTRLGPVRDVRVSRRDLRVVGIVVGDGPFAGMAHGWGFAEGRAQGPWVLRALTRRATARARFIPADAVVDWGPGEIVVTAEEKR